MRTFNSSDLLARTDETNMDELDVITDVKVICHDGTAVTTNRHIQYLHAFLHFNRQFDTPVSVRQIPAKDSIPTPRGHTDAMELAVNVVYDHHNGTIRKHDIAVHWTLVSDALNNAAIADIEHFSATIDAEDIMDIISDPYVVGIRNAMKTVLCGDEGPEIKSNAIINCNSLLIDFIKTEGVKKWPMSGIVQHIRAESIKLDQLMQLCNVVGYMTEIDSEIYPFPNCESFAEGMNYPYTYATNSSLGKKAAVYNKSPISETETLNRLMQQMTSQISDVEVGDCGSTKTSSIHISTVVKDAIVGMYYIPKVGAKAELITKEVVKANMSKLLDVRTVAGCDTDNPVGFCSTCGGSSMTNFVDDYNVGGASSCYVFGKNSQLILKTKHVDIINFNVEETLSIELRDFMTLSPNGKEVYIRDSCKEASISFLATKRIKKDKSSNGQFLQTVFSVESLDGAELTSFGEVETLTLMPNNGLDEAITDVKLKQGSVANFSLDLLTFIRSNPEKLTMIKLPSSKTGFNIDLTGFDNRLPIFNMPFKHFDSLSLHNQLETFFLSPNGKLPGEVLTDFTSFSDALVKLTKMTYPRLGAKMGLLQIILLPFTVRDSSKGDYRVPFAGDACEFGKMNTIRKHRSLSVVTIATGQADVFGHLAPLVRDNMQRHQYDSQFV